MNFIFFDVDGVLNGTDERGNLLEPEIQEDKVHVLVQIAKQNHARLIMSSTWRTGWNTRGELIKNAPYYRLLRNLLLANRCKIYSITPILDYDRNKEIKQWLSEHAKPTDKWICIDDEKSYYKHDDFFKDKVIQTAPPHCDGAYGYGDVVGLFDHHVAEAKLLFDKQN